MRKEDREVPGVLSETREANILESIVQPESETEETVTIARQYDEPKVLPWSLYY